MIALCLIAAASTGVGACGDDDDDSASSGDTAPAEAPAPTRAFGGLSTALEPQGYDVEQLPRQELGGAEDGVSITGSKSGTGHEFTTEEKAKDYAAEVKEGGSGKTTTVGTVVFQASTQDDADFFADAYEGG
jgi:hypothetical protein